MHITRIELEDIKSHAHFDREFQRGTTAISGENGAGKTTLIEAVAWALFDLLDYKKDDFVRRGAKKGVVKVTFESGLDEREYLVYRDTGTGYYVYDPRLKTRIAEKKEEVTRFLWQHLGLEAGTDLESLFRRAIGVPQGTFTAIFLETAADRKRAFDKLLKVEEYRRSSDELLKTARYVDGRITDARENIARAEGELARIETLKSDSDSFLKQVSELSAALETVMAEVAAKSGIVRELDTQEASFNAVRLSLDKLQTDFTRAELIEKQKEIEYRQAVDAAEKIKLVTADYQSHLEALGKLKELDRERIERDKLNSELKRVETAQVNVRHDQKRIQEKLEAALKSHQTIKELEPKAADEESFGRRLKELQDDLTRARSAQDQIELLDKKLTELRTKYRENSAEIENAARKSAEAEHLSKREEREKILVGELARLRAKLESDRKFQDEIQNGMCPILSAKCLNLEEGQTLDGFVTSQFAGIKSEIATLETEHKDLARMLKVSREAEQSRATVKALTKRDGEIEKEGTLLKSEKAALEKFLLNSGKIKTEFSDLEVKLKSLDHPGARIRMLKKETENEITLRTQRTGIEKNLERLTNDQRILVEQLESYKFLDSQWKEFTEQRERTSEAHRHYVLGENLAKSLPERDEALKKSQIDLKEFEKGLVTARKDVDEKSKVYDRDRHLSERAALSSAEKKSAETSANLENAKKRAGEIEKELVHLEKIRKEMEKELAEKEYFEKIGDATKFIRDTLKEAAPLVARNYVLHVSSEANQMFREITGNAEHTLKWEEDYGIVLEQGGFDRPFGNLSGGEQMAAALSVRLALLKQLSDIKLAFFDEPTTNMDLERRERLAEQISLITERQTFDQLFIISHDDTFEGFADNVVSIRHDAEE